MREVGPWYWIDLLENMKDEDYTAMEAGIPVGDPRRPPWSDLAYWVLQELHALAGPPVRP